MHSGSDSENCPPAGPGTPTNSKLSTSSTIVSQGGFSYVNVHKIPGCESVNGRGRRPLLTNKANEATSSSLSFGCVKALLPRSTQAAQTHSVSVSFVQRLQSIDSTPFQLLPPLPRASSLQLPSLMDISPCASPLAPVLVPPSIEITSLIKQDGTNASLAANYPAGGRLAKISPFMHPNSPYVPWTPEMKRRFLQPSATPSPVPDFYARRYSDTNICSPESRNGAVRGQECKKLSKQLGRLTFIVGKNIKQAAKRISRFTKPLTAVDVQGHHDSASVDSLDSSQSNTLAEWLQRQKLLFEETVNLSKEISLDDHERSGDRDIHPESALHDENRVFASLRKHPSGTAHSHLHSCSDSHIVGSVGFSSSRGECNCTGTMSKRSREMSMPGGWTFD